jgi:4-diphosphocytidyl-2-C-methyl-D-erythritol kinase
MHGRLIFEMMVHAYAKINLALYVKNRRRDGFHNIETIFTQVDLKDKLYFRQSENLFVETDIDRIPSGPGNLAYRAAQKVKKAFKIEKGVHIRIKKNIPAGAGLAGGSADAAAAVKGLLDFWKVRLDSKKTNRIMKDLGADVPYCFLGGTAIGRGKGERLKPLPDFKGYTVLLVNPNVSVSTAWAYGILRRSLTQGEDKCNLYQKYGDYIAGRISVADLLHNDFEKPVFKRYPRIRRVKETLLQFGPEGACMSGSGSTVFGIFKSRKNGQAAFEFFGKKGMWACITRPKGSA